MALFVLTGIDRQPGGLDLRLATREAHFAYLQSRPGVVRLAGPFLDEAGAMIGSMMVIEADSLAEAQAFQAQDPYAKAGLFAGTDLKPWRVTIGGIG